MTGKREVARIQPGGRAPAPGQLAVVQAFINTHYDLEHDHGAEVLATPEALSVWLHRAGLSADRPYADVFDLENALAVREGLRALAAGGPETDFALQRLDGAARGAAVEVRLGGEQKFAAAPGTGAAGAIGVLMALTACAIADGSWSRLKICPGEHCGWAFYDHSKNRSGRWCAMSVCGGRTKARRHYRRQRSAER
ncbi:MAG: CGNR zinc finger domain-containing protein [Solirubrobacteraceae bacterium]